MHLPRNKYRAFNGRVAYWSPFGLISSWNTSLLAFSCSYPGGYTMLFIPSYAADYTGYHWAVYDKDHAFYSFDDGDATSGEILRACCNTSKGTT